MNTITEEREEQHTTTADLVNQSTGEHRDGPQNTENRNEALFSGDEAQNFRTRWHEIQGSFVDEPRRAVEQSDELVASTIKRLAEVFAGERSKLEHEWSQGQDVSTEDLRQALRRYRSFFDRLLSV